MLLNYCCLVQVAVAVTFLQTFTCLSPLFEVITAPCNAVVCKPIVNPSKYSEQSWRPFGELLNITVQISGNIENLFQIQRGTPIDLLSNAVGATIEPYQIVVLYTPSQQNSNMKFAGKFVYGEKF